jgi:hypothetical protein
MTTSDPRAARPSRRGLDPEDTPVLVPTAMPYPQPANVR